MDDDPADGVLQLALHGSQMYPSSSQWWMVLPTPSRSRASAGVRLPNAKFVPQSTRPSGWSRLHQRKFLLLLRAAYLKAVNNDQSHSFSRCLNDRCRDSGRITRHSEVGPKSRSGKSALCSQSTGGRQQNGTGSNVVPVSGC